MKSRAAPGQFIQMNSSEVESIRVWPDATIHLVEFGDLVMFGAIQLEIENVEIFSDA